MFHYRFTDAYFILWVINQCYLFDLSISSAYRHWGLFRVVMTCFYLPLLSPIISSLPSSLYPSFFPLSYYYTARYSNFNLCTIPIPRISCFSKEPWFLLLLNAIQKPRMEWQLNTYLLRRVYVKDSWGSGKWVPLNCCLYCKSLEIICFMNIRFL